MVKWADGEMKKDMLIDDWDPQRSTDWGDEGLIQTEADSRQYGRNKLADREAGNEAGTKTLGHKTADKQANNISFHWI